MCHVGHTSESSRHDGWARRLLLHSGLQLVKDGGMYNVARQHLAERGLTGRAVVVHWRGHQDT
jgi:hypothetical protein